MKSSMSRELGDRMVGSFRQDRGPVRNPCRRLMVGRIEGTYLWYHHRVVRRWNQCSPHLCVDWEVKLTYPSWEDEFGAWGLSTLVQDRQAPRWIGIDGQSIWECIQHYLGNRHAVSRSES